VKNIYVGNLSVGTTENALRSLFVTYGTVERINIVTDQVTGQRKNFAFVEMPNDAEAEKASAALNGSGVDGKTLVVNEARPKRAGGGRPTNKRGRFAGEAPSRPYTGQILT
jgi:RNA recognition motif-containing protein